MHKHLQNLQRLFQKMQTRYGESDELVVQLQQELAAFEVKFAMDRAAINQGRRQLDMPPAAHALH